MSATIEQEQVPSAAPLPQNAASRSAAKGKAEPWLALSVLALLGGISGVAYYLGFVQPYPMPGNYKTPLLDLARLSGAAGSAANSWAFTWIVLFTCYVMAFRFCPSSDNMTRVFRRVALSVIFVFAAFYSINMLFMYPVGAADISTNLPRQAALSLRPQPFHNPSPQCWRRPVPGLRCMEGRRLSVWPRMGAGCRGHKLAGR